MRTHPQRRFSRTEADDEIDNLITKWRPSWTSQGSPSLPLATRELPMPAKQRLGRDEETAPPPSREQSAERRKDRSVRGPLADAAMEQTLEKADLVAEHHSSRSLSKAVHRQDLSRPKVRHTTRS